MLVGFLGGFGINSGFAGGVLAFLTDFVGWVLWWSGCVFGLGFAGLVVCCRC